MFHYNYLEYLNVDKNANVSIINTNIIGMHYISNLVSIYFPKPLS